MTSRFAIIFLMTFVGGCIRFSNLTFKTIWSDEVASIAHALGNSFEDIQLNKIINLEDLLQPLKVHDYHGLIDVIKHGIFEDFVPPFHFILLHLWILLFKTSDELVSLFTARSLSVLLSVVSIPAIYFLSKNLFRDSHKVWLIAALVITLSPYSIALAQETRHYSISIVFVILSVLIFFRIFKQLLESHTLSGKKLCILAMLNFIGIASHYFFIIVLVSEIVTLIVVATQYKSRSNNINIFTIALVNLAVALMWLPIYFLNNSRDELTSWANIDTSRIETIANLFFQPIVSSVIMFFLLPLESSNIIVVIISAVVMTITMVLLSLLIREGISSPINKNYDLSIKFLTIYLATSISTLILISCLFQKDFLTTPRYHFIYFPVLVVLISYYICQGFDDKRCFIEFKKLIVRKILIFHIFILIISSSSLCVINNLSFLKPHSPDIMAEIISNSLDDNKLIITTGKTLNNISSLMALGWQFSKIHNKEIIPKFFIDKGADPTVINIAIQDVMNLTINGTSLWVINYEGNIKLDHCLLRESSADRHIRGYNFKHYGCS